MASKIGTVKFTGVGSHSVNPPNHRDKLGAIMRVILVPALFASIACSALAQQNPQWIKESRQDAAQGLTYTEFKLAGTYLKAPKHPLANAEPTLAVACAPGSFSDQHRHGRFLGGVVSVGAKVREYELGTSTGVNLRVDGRNLATEGWAHANNDSGVVFDDGDFHTMLFGHPLERHADTNPQVRSLTITVNGARGGAIEMQFKLPESSEVAEACGLIWHD